MSLNVGQSLKDVVWNRRWRGQMGTSGLVSVLVGGVLQLDGSAIGSRVLNRAGSIGTAHSALLGIDAVGGTELPAVTAIRLHLAAVLGDLRLRLIGRSDGGHQEEGND